MIGISSSRTKLLESAANNNHTNSSLSIKSPNYKDVDTALDHMFKGFSFYSEPLEEREVQRQIREYLKIKDQIKRRNTLKAKNDERGRKFLTKEESKHCMPPLVQ